MSFLDKIKQRVLDIVSVIDTDKINQTVEEYKKSQDELIKNLENAKSNYIDRTTLGDNISVDLKRLTSDDITKIAKSIIDEDYQTKKNDIYGQYKNMVEKAESALTETEKKATEKINRAQEDLKQKTDDINSKGIKNNVSRSSAVELSKRQAVADNEALKKQAESELEKVKQDKMQTVASAEKNKQEQIEKAEKEYNANLTAKTNELKDLKDSASEYENEYIDKREATNYSNELVSLVTEFALSYPKEVREQFLNQNKQLKNLLTEDEINYVKQMVLS